MFNLFKKKEEIDIATLIKEGAQLVDVRTNEEYKSGSIQGAINIPLHLISTKVNELKSKQPIIVFCRSGNRSGQAKSILKTNGLTEVYNGGGVSALKNKL